MGKLEDKLVERVDKKVPKNESEELILLRTKLEVRTMFMRMWQTVALALMTGVTTGILSKLLIH